MDFSFDSIAIVPELICLLIIPEYYSGFLAFTPYTLHHIGRSLAF